jgi:hypothetical protein
VVRSTTKAAVVPIFFANSTNAGRYRDDTVYPFVAQLREDEIARVCFHYDSATAHTAHASLALLREVFGHRIISSNIWPPRSPDLTPRDFYLWGALKIAAYKDSPRSPDKLKESVTSFTESILRTELVRAFDDKMRTVDACFKVRADHFQLLL